MSWQLQEAKQRFSELVRRTLAEGPQVVTRHGAEVVVAAREFRQVSEPQPDFSAFLLAGPDFDLLDLDRSDAPPRETDLGR